MEEISARTRINSRNLNAIEFDQVGDISSPFFYRSFVKQYAGEVGLEYNSLATAVESLASSMRQPDLPGQGEHQPVRVAPIQARPKRDFSWLIPTAVFLGVVALGSSGYAAWKFYQPFPFIQNSAVSSLFQKSSSQPASAALVPESASPAVHPETVHAKPAITTADTPPALAENAPLAAPPTPSTTKVVADKIHLELAATERTWLSVSADGKPAYSGILEAAQTKVLEGQESAKLRTGNAGGVNIIFNGKAIGTIGPRGQTRTVVFTKTGYEVQETEGSHPILSSHIGG